MLSTVLKEVSAKVEPGVTTKDLANYAAEVLDRLGGKPAFLGYQGFPDVICISVNDEVVHGIPSQKRVIKDGDIVSLDFGVLHKGLITDAAISVIAGYASEEDKRLLQKTKQALDAAIDVVEDGIKIGTIGAAAQYVLDRANFGIVRDFVGHGVGHQLHEEPNIPNYGISGQGPMLNAGMTIAIEPMATRGNHDVKIDKDGWTVRTADGSRAAHFEQTILITEAGAEILTPLP